MEAVAQRDRHATTHNAEEPTPRASFRNAGALGMVHASLTIEYTNTQITPDSRR